MVLVGTWLYISGDHVHASLLAINRIVVLVDYRIRPCSTWVGSAQLFAEWFHVLAFSAYPC